MSKNEHNPWKLGKNMHEKHRKKVKREKWKECRYENFEKWCSNEKQKNKIKGI